jgi:Notch-like protein
MLVRTKNLRSYRHFGTLLSYSSNNHIRYRYSYTWNQICKDCLNILNLIGDYKCECTSDWTSTHCESRIDSCADHPFSQTQEKLPSLFWHVPCTPHGVNWHSSISTSHIAPRHPVSQKHLKLPSKFIPGGKCNQQIDPCDSSPCYNNATCINHGNGLECQCPSNWKGTHCNEDIDECKYHPCENNGVCDLKLPSKFIQIPLLRHGPDWHSFTSDSHCFVRKGGRDFCVISLMMRREDRFRIRANTAAMF